MVAVTFEYMLENAMAFELCKVKIVVWINVAKKHCRA